MNVQSSTFSIETRGLRNLSRQECVDLVEDLLNKQFWIESCLRNKHLHDREKASCIALYLQYIETPARDDGYRYYKREIVANRMGNIPKPDKITKKGSREHTPGNKEQVLTDIVSILQENGLVARKDEPQKNNPTQQNAYLLFSPQFMNNIIGVAIEREKKSANIGGKRVPRCPHGCETNQVLKNVTTEYICPCCGLAFGKEVRATIIDLPEHTYEHPQFSEQEQFVGPLTRWEDEVPQGHPDDMLMEQARAALDDRDEDYPALLIGDLQQPFSPSKALRLLEWMLIQDDESKKSKARETIIAHLPIWKGMFA